MPAISRRRCAFEWLEARRTMAGDVTAQVVNGDLIVMGDSADNALRLTDFGDSELVGFNDANGNPTKINGVANGTFDYSGLTGNVVIRTGDGNDRVEVNGVLLPGALVIETGTGNDIVSSGGGADIEREFLIDLGPGDNQIAMRGSTFRDGSGPGILVGTSVIVNGGAGADTIRMSEVFVGQDFVMNTHDGADSVNLLFVIPRNFLGVDAGAGADRSQVENSLVRELQVNAGGGSDRVDINGSLLERVFAELGADGDLLVMNNTAISGTGSLSGGPGYELFFGRGNALGGASLAFFELFT
jgi:hypothetical protein